jgi:TolB-like protein
VLVGGVAVIVAILNPFKLEITPDQSAIAAENTLAIMYFENLVNEEDPRRLGEIVPNLLITDLSESEYVRVVSSQRLFDILKQKGKEGSKIIDRSTATDVATQAGAKWMLLGSILQEEPGTIVTSRFVDVTTGEVVASQRVEGGEGEKIFTVVDKMSREIRSDLDLPARSQEEQDLPVASVTTQSEEAYRHYIEGREHLSHRNMDKALASYRKAVECDSTFAMAYLGMSGYYVPVRSVSIKVRQFSVMIRLLSAPDPVC